MPQWQRRIELADAWRYRCFGPNENRKSPCMAPATWRAADARRHDAVTFYCDAHRPANAIPIDDGSTALELAVPGLTVLAGCTLRQQDAQVEAVYAIQSALSLIGARFVPADVRMALKTPRIVLSGHGH